MLNIERLVLKNLLEKGYKVKPEKGNGLDINLRKVSFLDR